MQQPLLSRPALSASVGAQVYAQPYGHTTPPGGRVTPPGGRVTPPAGRVTPPAGRVTPQGSLNYGRPVSPSSQAPASLSFGRNTPPGGRATHVPPANGGWPQSAPVARSYQCAAPVAGTQRVVQQYPMASATGCVATANGSAVACAAPTKLAPPPLPPTFDPTPQPHQDPDHDVRGIPVKSAIPPVPIGIIATCVFFSIGFGVSWAIYLSDKDKYNARFDSVVRYKLHHMYLALFLMRVGFQAIVFAAASERRCALVNPPDQHVYQVYGAKEPGLVRLVNDSGPVGRFNRAQRAVFNYLEVLPYTLLSYLLAGAIFPKAAMIIIAVFSVARLGYAIGYAKEPNARGPGLAIGGLAAWCLDALVLLVALKGYERD